MDWIGLEKANSKNGYYTIPKSRHFMNIQMCNCACNCKAASIWCKTGSQYSQLCNIQWPFIQILYELAPEQYSFTHTLSVIITVIKLPLKACRYSKKISNTNFRKCSTSRQRHMFVLAWLIRTFSFACRNIASYICTYNIKINIASSHTNNHFTALWILSWTTRVSRYQKKHSPTHTFRGHQSSLICFLHLLRSMASSLFNLHTWQSFSKISHQVFFGLPLGLAPSTSYSIYFFTQSLSSCRSTYPYHHNLFCCSTEIMSSNPSLSINPFS